MESIKITEEELDIEAYDGNLEEAISEAISKKTGFCHRGFTFTIVVQADLDKS